MAGNLKKLAMCAVVAFGGAAMAQNAEPTTAPAQEPVKAPSADAVKSTWDYFYRGQGQGPVLVDARLCTEVAKEGPNKFECVTEVSPDGVKAGSSVMVWQAYLVPQGDTIEDVTIQVKQGNVVRETKDVKLKGEGWRARQWTGVRLSKPGEWTITLLRGEQELKSIKVKAL
ncbi:hypothetical protein [Archangium sp.]|uniref:hypothetical protein n=1 Tax=Archangium sp. TaxID=1872627 RepID=UPI002D43B4A5|nr:hypothetical protein [Archangium sp.]HYO57470.1 hypothetical protein [Archangium sp.]